MSSLAYRYSAELHFKFDGDTVEIDPLYIRYIMIESLYIMRTFPVIYISLALDPDLYEVVVKYENQGTFFLTVNCRDINSSSSVGEASFSREFNYMISTSEPSYATPLSEGSKSPDGNFRPVTVALLCSDLLNAARAEKDVNDGILVSGVFGAIDTNTLIGKVINGFEKYNLTTIMKAPTHNNQFEELVIPPMNNRKEILQFIFDKAPFYDTTFTFFLDFHYAYLLDQTKEGCYIEDESGVSTIKFIIRDVTRSESYTEGMEIDGDVAKIHVNPSHVQIFPNKVQDKTSNNLVTVDEKGNLDAKELNVNRSENSDPKYTFKRGGNAQLYQNILESNLLHITIHKEGLNTGIFTPNKKYLVNSNESEEYRGGYFLIEKRDVLVSNNGVIRESTQFTLRKVGTIKDIGDTILPSRRSIPGANAGGATAVKKPVVDMSAAGLASTSTYLAYYYNAWLQAQQQAAQAAQTITAKSNKTDNNTVTKVATVRGIPRTVTVPVLDNKPVEEKSTGGVEYIEYDVTQPAVMRASYGKSKDDIVEELSEEEWAARTSIRGDAIGVIDVSNAGATKVIKSRKGGTLNKPLFK